MWTDCLHNCLHNYPNPRADYNTNHPSRRHALKTAPVLRVQNRSAKKCHTLLSTVFSGVLTLQKTYDCMSAKIIISREVWEKHSYCWFSHDVTKIQTTKLSILPKFYFHDKKSITLMFMSSSKNKFTFL